ncbi:hypothetical protein COCOBI_pt-0860 (chloroplast) [Coccomyxa sp. Obi]|nr:hypothetical protein COCOBI_pt-0860 [Coccomyxa sp. Obi]
MLLRVFYHPALHRAEKQQFYAIKQHSHHLFGKLKHRNTGTK